MDHNNGNFNTPTPCIAAVTDGASGPRTYSSVFLAWLFTSLPERTEPSWPQPNAPDRLPVDLVEQGAKKKPGQRRWLMPTCFLAPKGFSVTRNRLTALTRENFHEWLQDIRDNREDSV